MVDARLKSGSKHNVRTRTSKPSEILPGYKLSEPVPRPHAWSRPLPPHLLHNCLAQASLQALMILRKKSSGRRHLHPDCTLFSFCFPKGVFRAWRHGSFIFILFCFDFIFIFCSSHCQRKSKVQIASFGWS